LGLCANATVDSLGDIIFLSWRRTFLLFETGFGKRKDISFSSTIESINWRIRGYILAEIQESHQWVPTALLLLILLFFPFMLQIQRDFVYSDPNFSWWAWVYTIYSDGIRITSLWSFLGKSYDTILYLAFIIALERYYMRKTSLKVVKILGVLSIFPRLFPTISNLLISIFSFGGDYLHIGIPLPLPVIVGFIFLHFKPLPPSEHEWLEEAKHD
jgi:hypothetical protein